jgi:hypothetical protein
MNQPMSMVQPMQQMMMSDVPMSNWGMQAYSPLVQSFQQYQPMTPMWGNMQMPQFSQLMTQMP